METCYIIRRRIQALRGICFIRAREDFVQCDFIRSILQKTFTTSAVSGYNIPVQAVGPRETAARTEWGETPRAQGTVKLPRGDKPDTPRPPQTYCTWP